MPELSSVVFHVCMFPSIQARKRAVRMSGKGNRTQSKGGQGRRRRASDKQAYRERLNREGN